jgi:methionyl-tRNA formyltransferase
VSIPPPWRIVIVSHAPPAAVGIDAMCREAGHEPVALVASRRGVTPENVQPLVLETPTQLDVVFAARKERLAPIFRSYEPDLVICLGFPMLMPQEALDVPRLGAINMHPSKLPLYRGPIPLPWAIRNGETEIAMTAHRMEAEFDTGAILAQEQIPIDPAAWTFEEVVPNFRAALGKVLPRALERIARGEEGEPQEGDPGVYAGWFEDEFLEVDWTRTAREIHNQVRAWAFLGGLREGAPVGDVDGEAVKILRTSLEPVDGAPRVECGDAAIWIVESKPA